MWCDLCQLWLNSAYWAIPPRPSDVKIGKYIKLALFVKLVTNTRYNLDTICSRCSNCKQCTLFFWLEIWFSRLLISFFYTSGMHSLLSSSLLGTHFLTVAASTICRHRNTFCATIVLPTKRWWILPSYIPIPFTARGTNYIMIIITQAADRICWYSASFCWFPCDRVVVLCLYSIHTFDLSPHYTMPCPGFITTYIPLFWLCTKNTFRIIISRKLNT